MNNIIIEARDEKATGEEQKLFCQECVEEWEVVVVQTKQPNNRRIK
jgi:hypothetical protein